MRQCGSRSEILLREGKGGKDRVTLLSAGLRAPLASHLERVKAQHEADLRRELGSVELPHGYDIRTILELLGYRDVSTTMIYTHVLNRGGRGVRSPLDVAL